VPGAATVVGDDPVLVVEAGETVLLEYDGLGPGASAVLETLTAMPLWLVSPSLPLPSLKTRLLM
jgi:hypothetical protein